MGTRKLLIEWLRRRAPERVTEALAAELAAAFPEASESVRRKALLECGYPLDPLVEGVRQDSFEHLERTLVVLTAEYEASPAPRRHQIRQVVIRAREHAGFAARSTKVDEPIRQQKTEMSQWLLTWLENPPAFPVWARLRSVRLPGAD